MLGVLEYHKALNEELKLILGVKSLCKKKKKMGVSVNSEVPKPLNYPR